MVRAFGRLLRRPPRAGPFAEDAFPSRLHDDRLAAILGIALGVAFATCFVTGLISHFAQHPLHIGFLSMPASPGWLYRVTQGVHVATGIAAIPLLLAKLWTVFPKLFQWPPARSAAHAIERIALVPLVAGSIFQLFTGLADTARWYPWTFSFTVTHYWSAWIVIGSLIIHLGAKFATATDQLRPSRKHVRAPDADGPTRRGFLWAVGSAVAAVTVATVGQTLRPLQDVSVLAPRKPSEGPQGFPVNKSAAGAQVTTLATDPDYRLLVEGRVSKALTLSLAELQALPQHQTEIAITCVEGWSAGAHWSGVRMRDLLAMAGAAQDAEVVVHSMQRRGSYRSSELNVQHTRHDDTLLALRVNGERLHIDHGYPVRLISPNRPGVQQTKWVARLEVL